MSSKCAICVEEFCEDNIIICNKCDCKICRICMKKYLLDTANNIPKCPNCDIGFTTDQIQNYLGLTDYTTFLQNATEISLAIEKQKISQIMDDVEIYMKNNSNIFSMLAL